MLDYWNHLNLYQLQWKRILHLRHTLTSLLWNSWKMDLFKVGFMKENIWIWGNMKVIHLLIWWLLLWFSYWLGVAFFWPRWFGFWKYTGDTERKFIFAIEWEWWENGFVILLRKCENVFYYCIHDSLQHNKPPLSKYY